MADKNITQIAGWGNAGFSDQEYIDEFGLDPNKDINKQMLDLVEKENVQFYMQSGYKEGDAKRMAAKRKADASKNIQRAVIENKKSSKT